ncbi:MAG: response regulator transcription factor [Elusimicrobiales bacterium]|nr:response regulator transcription factor [Elusimicrobiales bacterium]
MNKILLVDDETSFLNLLKHALESQGYMVIAAEKGETAVNWIKEVPLDLAIIDLGLPDISGLEVCKAIKDNPRTRHTKVIILTGNTTNEARIEGNLGARAELYLNKPIQIADLRSAVSKLLEKNEKEKLMLRASFSRYAAPAKKPDTVQK